MRLKTERLTLREVEASDYEKICEFRAHPEVAAGISKFQKDPVWTRKEVDAAIASTSSEPRRLYDFAIELKTSRDLIGLICLSIVSLSVGTSASMGFELARPYWGKGFMSEAARATMRFAFDDLQLHSIHGYCFADNHNSIRLFRRLGLRYGAVPFFDNLRLSWAYRDLTQYLSFYLDSETWRKAYSTPLGQGSE